MKSPFRLALALLLLLAPFARAAAPVVSNVRAAQRTGTKLVDIYYNVTAGSAVTVTIAVSSDGGTSYSVPAATFTGDFGSGVQPGSDRHVVWSAGIDWNGQFTTRGRVRVTAEDGSGPAGMAFIPAGAFQMGDNYGIVTDAPVRSVVVSSFYMDRFQVTKELWDQVYQWAAGNGYTFGQGGEGVAANHPVQNLTWYDAVRWCNARSQKEGRTPAYYTDTAQTLIYKAGDVDLTVAMVKWTSNGYRLPTEAEWEKAARGGLAGHHFPWPSIGPAFGSFLDGSKANYSGSGDPFESSGPNTTQTTPVGYYNGSQIPAGVDMANGYGLYDMAGNVWKWCWDWYASYDNGALIDPRGPNSGSTRVFRPGSFGDTYTVYLRCASRLNYDPSARSNDGGFRCVLSQP